MLYALMDLTTGTGADDFADRLEAFDRAFPKKGTNPKPLRPKDRDIIKDMIRRSTERTQTNG